MKLIKGCMRLLLILSVVLAGFTFVMTEKNKWFKQQKPLLASEVEKFIGVPYVVENIPLSNKRPGTKRTIKYIVIHNTANPTSSAQNERDYLVNEQNTSSTSFNIVLDDQQVIEAIPVSEVAFHAGTWEGNRYGIGIEICESGNYEQSEENAAKLTAYLMKQYGLSIEAVKTHHDFSGKICPRLLLDHWQSFKEKVEKYYQRL